MAAFLRKLFKSRKTEIKSPAPAVNKQAQPATTPKSADEERAVLIAQQLQAVQGMPAQTRLAELAINGLTADVRSRAVNGLRDESLLQDVARQAKGRDKRVFQVARQALQQLRDAEVAQLQLEQKRQQLIQQAKDQARSEDATMYEPRLETLVKQWQSVEADASTSQTTEFLSAVHHCRERIRQMQLAQQRELQQRDKADQRQQTLQLLDDTLLQLKTVDALQRPTLTGLDALHKTQHNRWLEASEDTKVSAAEQSRYDAASAAITLYVEARQRLDRVEHAIAELVANPDPEDQNKEPADQVEMTASHARTLLETIDWPTTFPLPEQVALLQTLARQRKKVPPQPQPDLERQKSLTGELDSALTELDAALDQKQLKPAKQLLKNAQQIAKKLDARHQRPFSARLQLLQGQLSELADWQGFATEPKQIALCEQMEHLATQPIDPEAKAAHIKELQEQWKSLGGSSDRPLWSRFKHASDAAYEPCKAYFAAKSDLKSAHLATRRLICQQLEGFVAHADWSSVDWKAAERIHQTARQEWKSAWPVEFRDNRPVQKKFDETLKQLEAKLDVERERNEARKQAIIDAAEELISTEPLADAMTGAKQLQSEWQAIGITRHREDRKLWQAFRQACDAIFARREQESTRQKQEAELADEQALLVINRADTAISENAASEQLDQLWAELQASNTETLSSSTRNRHNEVRQKLHSARQRRDMIQRVENWQECIRARGQEPLHTAQVPPQWVKFDYLDSPVDFHELAIRAEILADQPSPASDQRKRMEIQVQRLAQSIGSSEQADDMLIDAEQLVAMWCLAPAQTAITEELSDRMVSAVVSLA